MKIKIGNTVFDSDKTPICLELTHQERDHISNMSEHNSKYALFPASWDGTTPEQRLAWMKAEVDPSHIYIYFDCKRSKIAVRSDIDGLTCLHYSDGTKHEVSALYMTQQCIEIAVEPRTNWLLYSKFMLNLPVRANTLTYMPALEGEKIDLHLGFARWYKLVSELVTEEDHKTHGAVLEWVEIHRELSLQLFKAAVPGA